MAATTCPVFRPTEEEFSNFYRYMQLIEATLGEKHAGICKIIPPSGWYERDYSDCDSGLPSSFVVKTPVKQVVTGRAGVYQTLLFELKDMKVKDFIAYDEKNQCADIDLVTRERKFWRSLGGATPWADPIYGADMVGTLFGDDPACSWNLNKIDSLLRLIGNDVPGVNSSMLYFGTWRAMFSFHVEDMNLYSINYLHAGARKSWYSVGSHDSQRFENMANAFHQSETWQCSEYLRHKTTLFSPQKLKEFGVPFTTAVQEPGEFIITFPKAYHAGFNHGFNVAEATNFATPAWFNVGKKAKVCKCQSYSVRIDVDFIETMYHRSIVSGDCPYQALLLDSQDFDTSMEYQERMVCLCYAKSRTARLSGSGTGTEEATTDRSCDSNVEVETEWKVENGWYTCKKCLARCHLTCLSASIPDAAVAHLCVICHDVEEKLTADSNSSDKSPSFQSQIVGALEESTKSSAVVPSVCTPARAALSSSSSLAAASAVQPVKKKKRNADLLLSKSIASTSKSAVNSHQTAVKRQCLEATISANLEGDIIPRRDSNVQIQPTTTNMMPMMISTILGESFPYKDSSSLVSSSLSSSSSTSTAIDMTFQSVVERAKRALAARGLVSVVFPGNTEETIGTLVDVAGRLARFHDAGDHRMNGVWVSLTDIRILDDFTYFPQNHHQQSSTSHVDGE